MVILAIFYTLWQEDEHIGVPLGGKSAQKGSLLISLRIKNVERLP